jgi:primase-polymerase (primpol)-like protein
MPTIPERKTVKYTGFGSAPPRCLPPIPDNVPAELRKLKQWVCWRYVWHDGKWTKIPTLARGYGGASTTEPRTWARFEDAVATYRVGRADGIGFVTCKRDPYVLIDLDHVFDPATGVIPPWAAEIVRTAVRERAYVEFSPSATGFHIYGKGKQRFTGAKANGAEIYSHGRFFTVTGEVVPSTSTTKVIGTMPETVALTRARIGEPSKGKSNGKAVPAPKGVVKRPDILKGATDAQILMKALSSKNGARLKKLLDGDTSDYKSDSEADLAAAGTLAFWFWLDPKAIERVMRASRLKREKWDKHKTYLARTIRCALQGRTEYYGKGGRS